MATSTNTTCSFTLTLSPEILVKLDQAFPAKAGKNAILLNKFKSMLQNLIVDAISKGIYPSFDKYFAISLEQCNRGCPQIRRKGFKNMRLSDMLEEIGFPLFKVIEKGCKFKRTLSRINFEPYAGAKYQSTRSILRSNSNNTIHKKIQDYLNNFSILDEYKWKTTNPTAIFHTSPINSISLTNYIYNLYHDKHTSKYKIEKSFDQAVRILCFAYHGNGEIDFKIKSKEKPDDKDFGRIYYSGLNIQNINKEVRAAMLGNCYEYDVISSVISWKMSELTRISKSNTAAAELINFCQYTNLYLKDKSKFQSIVKEDVLRNSSISDDEKTKLTKQIFTAMCFGASLKSNYWYDRGTIKYGSIRLILGNEYLYDKFIACPEVSGFYKEQEKISNLILNDAKLTNKSDINNKKFLKNKRNYFVKNKCISFLYQHDETRIMNQVRSELKNFGITPLANIHDAVILRKKLTKSQKKKIIDNVRQKTDQPFFDFSEKINKSVKRL